MEDKEQAMLFAEDELKSLPSGGAHEAAQEIARRPRLRPVNRQQLLLREVDVEKLIAPEHEARAIWAFVEELDKQSYYSEIRACEGMAGSPATDPQLLISLWVYSYAKGISSAREIARLCEYDPAYQWMTGMQQINYHTLSDFRVQHKDALDELFTEILGVLSAEGLVTLERVVHDGSKVRAHASGDTFRREERVKEHLKLAREQVVAMGDPREAEEVGPRMARARERAAREKVEKLKRAKSELEKIQEGKKTKEEKAEARVSMTDPEARIMKHGAGGGYLPSYNAEISTDCANGVIVGAGVTQSGADYAELVPAEERIEAGTGNKPKQMVADGGFSTRENVIAMSEQGVDFYGALDDGESQSAGQMKRRGVADEFRPDQFRYNSESDTYTCPAGKKLRYEGCEKRPGIIHYQYRAQPSECHECPFKDKCCPTANVKGRTVTRGVEDFRVVAYREKMETAEAKAIYKQRGPKAEFTNAWLKEKIRLRQFRLVGLVKVRMELLWAAIAYNISQWIRLRWRMRFAGAQ